jgi:glycosyltransferase involved in cell wall biosynthesis
MISVVIPTHNRYNHLLKAVESVKNQTYKDIEIIVVNDGSTDKSYEKNIDGVKMIHLAKSTKSWLGYGCGAHPRNIGMKEAKGKYIAFLDDDDVWLPKKLEKQVNAMKKTNTMMSCSEGYIGEGMYNKDEKYKLYNEEYWKKELTKRLNIEEFPDIFNYELIKKSNVIITSSLMFERSLIEKVGMMRLIKNGGIKLGKIKEKMYQDWDYWLGLLYFTDCVYVKDPSFYYDNS